MTKDDIDHIRESIEYKVRAEYELAIKESEPIPADALNDLLAIPKIPKCNITLGDESRAIESSSMVHAVNSALRAILTARKECIIFGQDVEDPKGGVFGLTKGLSTAFPHRIFNSPLAEATIAGVGAGLASTGLRPIIELQFIDFFGPAWTQISNNLTTLRWRSGGDWTCPVVIYAPYGGYFDGGGAWHSQACEAAFCHIPGIRVVVPSTAADAIGFFWSAVHADDPTLILLPKSLFHAPESVSATVSAMPFGKATIRREGVDITVVAWGNAVNIVESAVPLLGSKISLEIIDLRSLVPWDKDTVCQSLRKTGRLLVVQEDNVRCGVGQMIISEICSSALDWPRLKMPPQHIGRPNIHIGFNPVYAKSHLPQTMDVVHCVTSMILDKKE